jgi:protein-tyrosine phosphatase
MAEVLLRHRLGAAGIEARVHSAGLFLPGLPAHTDSARAMASLGHDLSAHRSRRMTADMVREADLVLGLAREHVREAVLLAPDAWDRCFTLKELVRRAEAAGGRSPGQPFEEWLACLHAGRRRQDVLGASADDDVADPYGLGLGGSERTARELDALVSRLVELGWADERRGAA